jgi:hypothetical protein
MEPFELLQHVATVCDRLGIRYLTVGSMATIAFGEPRFTNDIDVVIDLWLDNVSPFCAAFPAPEFYLSHAAVETAVRKRFQFNIIHPSSGLKVDCILPSGTPHSMSELSRGVRKQVREGFDAVFGSPEDVILKKMEYYQQGGSAKHLRDITGVLLMLGDALDLDYIDHWASKLGLVEIWRAVLGRADDDEEAP